MGRMRDSICLVIILVLALCGDAMSSPGNLLNSDFETGNFTGWTVGGSAIQSGVSLTGTMVTGTNVPTNMVGIALDGYPGNKAAWAKLDNGANPTDFTLEQQIAVVPNRLYDCGLSWGLASLDEAGTGTGKRELFVNGNLVSSASVNFTGSQFLPVSGTSFTTPPVATTATIKLRFTGGSGGGLAGFTFDNIVVQPRVPEPNCLGILLGALPLTLRRHKRANSSSAK